MTSSMWKTCPGCGLTLGTDTVVCGRCGHRFVVLPPPILPPPPLIQLPFQTATENAVKPKLKSVAISLALGLGGIGIHGFYLGNIAMGATLATMFVGGGLLAFVIFIASLAGECSASLTAVGLVPLLIAATVPLIQAARYAVADSETFQRRYVVERRWF